jgi:hypothetical protein
MVKRIFSPAKKVLADQRFANLIQLDAAELAMLKRENAKSLFKALAGQTHGQVLNPMGPIKRLRKAREKKPGCGGCKPGLSQR